jgi:hypothetical protein
MRMIRYLWTITFEAGPPPIQQRTDAEKGLLTRASSQDEHASFVTVAAHSFC